MTKFYSLLFVILALPALAAPKTTEDRAAEYFQKLQRAGDHKEILTQTKALNEAGYTKEGKTRAVLLGGGCGFAGCNYDHLVTTDFSTVGANPQTTVLAGVVEVWTTTDAKSLKRLLSQDDVAKIIVGDRE